MISFCGWACQDREVKCNMHGHLAAGVRAAMDHIITATHLRNWQGRQAQSDLPTLVRDLIWATADGLAEISFPGGDSVYRSGFDGKVRAERETVYVPHGSSVWEVGTDADPGAKAQKDYIKRGAEADRNTTFIFVTPRVFSKKEEWRGEKLGEGKWKDVRVYDADDLETWLSTTPAIASLWVERIAHLDPGKIRPAHLLFEEWRQAVDGFLSPRFVLAGQERMNCAAAIWDWLQDDNASILRLRAYSPNDGQVFISACLALHDGFGDWLVRCICCDEETTLRQLAVSPAPHFIVTSVDDRGIARKAIENNNKYCIITSYSASNFPKDDTLVDIPLRLSAEASSELERLGMDTIQADQFLRKSGRMLMAFRRELAGEHPCWATPEIQGIMSAVVLVPAWREDRAEDRKALESISGQTYDEIERSLKAILATPQTPIQHVSPVWKLLSPMDAWRCLGPRLTQGDFDRFRAVVVAAFTAPDPVMDLPADQRWAALVYGKQTPYSTFVRKGLLQSIIIISVFGETFGLEVLAQPQAWVDSVVSDIFAGCAEEKKWNALVPYLPELAEAAPQKFLDELDRRLNSSPQVLASLFTPVGDYLAAQNNHVHLIWALERVGWFPEYFAQVMRILFKLNDLDPGGNVSPHPMGALRAFYCPFEPQTMASWDMKIGLLKSLLSDHQKACRDILLSIIDRWGKILGRSSRPGWREINLVCTKTYGEVYSFSQSAAEILIEHSGQDGILLAELVNIYSHLRPESKQLVKDLLRNLVSAGILINIEPLRSSVRKLLHRKKSYEIEDSAEIIFFDEIYMKLEPEDLFSTYIWLFENYPDLPTGSRDKEYDEIARDLNRLRIEAINSILSSSGIAAVKDFSLLVEAPNFVGYCLGDILNHEQIGDLYKLIEFVSDAESMFCRAVIWSMKERFGEEWLKSISREVPGDKKRDHFLALCCLALTPCEDTWALVEENGAKCEQIYWSGVDLYHYILKVENVNNFDYIIKKLIQIKRVDRIISIAHLREARLTYSQLVTCISSFIEHPVSISNVQYILHEILDKMRQSPSRIDDDVIRFEWQLTGVSDYKNRQLLLHKRMSIDPSLFKEIIDLYCDANNTNNVKAAFHVLNSWKTIPGVQADGAIDANALSSWIDEVRRNFISSDRLGFVDNQIGKVMAHANSDEDGLFPCKDIRDIYEEKTNPELREGFVIGVLNKRGVTRRAPYDGGRQEYDLSKEYKEYAERCRLKWPKMARALDDIARTYEGHAKQEDKQVQLDDMSF